MNYRFKSVGFPRLEKSEHTAQRRNDQEQRILERKLKSVEKGERVVQNELYRIRQEKCSQMYYSCQAQSIFPAESKMAGVKFVNTAGECDDGPREQSKDSPRSTRTLTQSANCSRRKAFSEGYAGDRLHSADCYSEPAPRTTEREAERVDFENLKLELRRRHSVAVIRGISKERKERRKSAVMENSGEERGLQNSAQWQRTQSLKALSARIEQKSPSKGEVRRPVATTPNFSADKTLIHDQNVESTNEEHVERARNLFAAEKILSQINRRKSTSTIQSRKVRFSVMKHGADTDRSEASVHSAKEKNLEAKDTELAALSAGTRVKRTMFEDIKQENDNVVLVTKAKVGYSNIEPLALSESKSESGMKLYQRKNSWAVGTTNFLSTHIQEGQSNTNLRLPRVNKTAEGNRRKSCQLSNEGDILSKNEEKIAQQAIMRQKEIEMATDNIKKLSLQHFNGAKTKEQRVMTSIPLRQANDGLSITLLEKKKGSRPARGPTEISLLSARHKFDTTEPAVSELDARTNKEMRPQQALWGLSQGIDQCRYLRCELR